MDNLYKRSLREQWDASLMGAPFWEGVTQDTQELVGSEEQGMC